MDSRIHKPKKSVLVAEAIAEDIVNNGYRPGHLIATEAQMLAEFGVGRATLREALRLLEADGLVVVRPGPNGGVVVQQPAPDSLARLLSVLLTASGSSFREVLEARALIEPELARRAATRASSDELKQIDQTIAEMRTQIQKPSAFLNTSTRFHTMVAHAAGNKVLSSFWQAVQRISDGQQAGAHYGQETLDGALRAHQRIAQALRDKNPDGAAATMRKHVEAQLRYLEAQSPQVLDSMIRGLNASKSPSGTY